MLDADLIVIGGGIAGSAAALAAARKGAEVVLLTKLPDPEEANTRYAQGGIIYTAPDDSPDLLTRDILEAGAGAGDREAARLLATEGPPLVRKLLIEELGVPFDRHDGTLHLTREGAHSVARIIHHKDTTGAEIQHALTRAVRKEGRITVLPDARAMDLAVSGNRCVGVHVLHEGGIETLSARGVVLATGGLGGLYEHTTNPPGATGDGVALALRAGAAVRDLHYVQFHPTALYTPGEAPGGTQPLISEAVRGEGGVLLDPDGDEFVDHPLGSLAPRDVVARGIRAMMDRTGSPCAYLDITHKPAPWLKERFPAIHAGCLRTGVNIAEDPIPVVPAAHYACGGVMADAHGRTSLRGLWAAGEVAGTGLHGANRLASTSLLEGLVWGWRAGEDAARPGPVEAGDIRGPERIPESAPDEAWRRLRHIMWERAGLVRSGEGLTFGLEELAVLERRHGGSELGGPLLVARKVMEGALSDTRSRGCHYRLDEEAGRVGA